MIRRRMLLSGCIICCLVCIPLLQTSLHRMVGTDWKQESMTYLPGGGNVKAALFGFETTVAHYLWIRTVLYFGGHTLTDRQYPWLIDMVDIITRLCPWFYPAYEFAGLMIPDVCGDPEAARIILERGLTSIGATKWNVAFYMGMIHFKYYRDRKTAAEYFVRAALTKGAPENKLLSLAHSFFVQADPEAEGMQYLIFAYQTSENPEVRRHLAEMLRHVPGKKPSGTAE